jgi:hypothetical protein
MVQIEIDLSKLERGTHIERVKVTRGGKTFWRKQRVGVKEEEKKVDIHEPPSKVIMDIIKESIIHTKDEKWGFKDLKSDGTVLWRDIIIKGSYEPDVDHINFKISGNKITNLDNGKSITLSEKFLSDSKDVEDWRAGNLAILGNLDIDSNLSLAKDYNKAMSTSVEREIDGFIPEYESPSGESEEKGKYSAHMGLKFCNNVPDFGRNSLISYYWYSGDKVLASLVGNNVKDIFDGKFDKDNILHSPLKLLIETSKKIAKKYSSDYIYRGETNVETVKDIVSGIVSDGSVKLSPKMTSWTENEKLGRWYASKHTQGTETKSNVMIKLSKDEYLDNVIFDYRACGIRTYPEQEITIHGGGVELTGENVMVYMATSKRKTKKWMTLDQYITEDGEIEDLISQMVIE